MRFDLLVIHCTATPKNRAVSSDDIRKWHLEDRGWSVVGYSDMIHLDGRIENLHEYNHDDIVDPWEITNGARGFNSKARHVVYVGGGYPDPQDTRTQAQFESLEAYVKVTVFRHPDIKVCGHNQLSNKACPSFDVPRFCRMIGIPEKNIM